MPTCGEMLLDAPGDRKGIVRDLSPECLLLRMDEDACISFIMILRHLWLRQDTIEYSTYSG